MKYHSYVIIQGRKLGSSINLSKVSKSQPAGKNQSFEFDGVTMARNKIGTGNDVTVLPTQ